MSLKNREELCREKWHMVSKMTYEIWWILQKWLNVLLDKSSVYVFAEGMYFLNKSSPLILNFLDFLLIVWSCSNSSCDFWNQMSVFVETLHHFINCKWNFLETPIQSREIPESSISAHLFSDVSSFSKTTKW